MRITLKRGVIAVVVTFVALIGWQHHRDSQINACIAATDKYIHDYSQSHSEGPSEDLVDQYEASIGC